MQNNSTAVFKSIRAEIPISLTIFEMSRLKEILNRNATDAENRG
jgi:hypothetical protein